MVFHNNKLVEIPLFDDVKTQQSQSSPPPSRTGSEDFILQEETADKKRKRMETMRIQTLHGQPAVDAARAADMDHIHFSEPFQGYNFAANAENRGPHFYERNTYYPWEQNPRNGDAFYDSRMPESSELSQSLSGATLMPDSFNAGSFATPEPTYSGGADTFHGDFDPTYHNNIHTAFSGDADTTYHSVAPSTFSSDIDAAYPDNADPFAVTSFAAGLGETSQTDEALELFTQEDAQEEYIVSATPLEESDFAASESEDERPRKVPKLNKDGVPRKPRKPRAKLLKWTDDDWKNACLGLVWACGEIGIQIPFEQAAQVVGEKCTAGALQQALLKLRSKQVAEGHQIPNLRMAWTRKNKYAASSAKTKASQEPEANKPRKKPTRVEGTQALVVTLNRAYNDRDREGMARPYKWKKPSRKARSGALQSPANMKQEDTYTQAAVAHDYGVGPHTPGRSTGYLPPTPVTGDVTPFGHYTGYLQGMAIGGGEFTNLLTTEGLHELGNGFADASDDVFST